MITTYPKCRTCRHFNGPRDSDTCSRITPDSEEASLVDSDHCQDVLYVHPDKFGCLLHSELETEKNKP